MGLEASRQTETTTSQVDLKLRFPVELSWRGTLLYVMGIVEMAETRDFQSLAAWTGLEIGHVTFKEMIEEALSQPQETSGGLPTGIGTVFDLTLLRDGPRILGATTKSEVEMPRGDPTRAAVCRARVACHHQERRHHQLTGQISYHPYQPNDRNSSTLSELRLFPHLHAQSRPGASARTLEIDPERSHLDDTLLREITKTPDMTSDKAVMVLQINITNGPDQMRSNHLLDLEVTGRQIDLETGVLLIDHEMALHSSQHSLHHGQWTRTMDD